MKTLTTIVLAIMMSSAVFAGNETDDSKGTPNQLLMQKLDARQARTLKELNDIHLTKELKKFQQPKGDVKKMLGDNIGNGGDGVILRGKSKPQVATIKDLHFDFDSLKITGRAAKKEMQLYSLDLTEMGIAKDASLEFSDDLSSSQDTVCILTFGCYEVKDSILFNQLMDRKGFFGGEDETSDKLNMSTDNGQPVFAINYQLATLFENYFKYDCLAADMTLENITAQMHNSKELPYSEDEILAAKNNEKVWEDKYMRVVKESIPNLRKPLYSSETILAIGIINKLQEIKQVNAEFGQLLQDVLLDLDWLLLEMTLREVDDEGAISSQIILKTQMALRKYGVVKITRSGWLDSFTFNEEAVAPMDVPNKIALIFHEVIYEILAGDNQTNSELARLATGYLFMPYSSGRYIRKAARIVLK